MAPSKLGARLEQIAAFAILNFRMGFTLVPAKISSKVGEAFIVVLFSRNTDRPRSAHVIGSVDLRTFLLDFSSRLFRVVVVAEAAGVVASSTLASE